MTKEPEASLLLPREPKFPKISSLSSLRTQSQFPIEKGQVPFSRRVSDETKQLLIQLITGCNYNMMDAAKMVKISYSSAKKIFTRFRRQRQEETKRRIKATQCTAQAAYSFVRSDTLAPPTRVQSISLIAGVEQRASHSALMLQQTNC